MLPVTVVYEHQLRNFCIHKRTVSNQNMLGAIIYFSLKCLMLNPCNLSQFGSVSSVYHCVKRFSVMSTSLYQFRIQIIETHSLDLSFLKVSLVTI